MAPRHKPAPELFVYPPLPHGNFFRYLILEPGCSAEPLACRLKVGNLEDVVDFEAISYVWGSDVKSEHIFCNSKTAHITPNLSQALRRLRHSSLPRALWADSLCIDQDNDIEKGQQVSLMGQIFARATKVLIHISGADEVHASRVSSLVSEVDVMVQRNLQEIVGAGPGEFPHLNCQQRRQTLRDPRWGSLGHLLSQPWFTRGWVVQEAALAQNGLIVWDRYEIDWNSLLRCKIWAGFRCHDLKMRYWVDNFKGHIHEDLYLIRHPEETRGYTSVTSTGLSIAAMLDSARDMSLQDPRDRIFAFLSLEGFGSATTTHSKAAINADYTKSTEEIYTQFARQQILRGDVGVLHFAQHYEELAASPMPSWAPRWDQPAHFRRDPWALEPLKASEDFDGELHREAREQILIITGVVFDHIIFQSNPIEASLTEHDVASLWRMVSRLKLCTAYNSELDADVFLSTLCHDILAADVDWPTWAAEQVAYAKFLKRSMANKRQSARQNAFPRIQSAVRDLSNGRRFISTERGLLGVAPAAAKENDVCCIIFGCATPFILRRIDTGPQSSQPHYRLIGDVWITGTEAYYDEGGGFCAPGTGSEMSKDWVKWGLKEQDIFIA